MENYDQIKWWNKISNINKIDILLRHGLKDFYFKIGEEEFKKSGYLKKIFHKEYVGKLYKVIHLGEVLCNEGYLVFPKNKKYKLNRRSLSQIPNHYFLTISYIKKPDKNIINQEILNKKIEIFKRKYS